MQTLFEKDNEFIANTYKRFPIAIKSGNGSMLYDYDGKEYIDMGSGIAVNTFGACDEEWKKAVIKQLDLVQHTSNLYYTSPCVELAEKLCQRTGMKKVFFSNSGAEANECAIKVARKWACENKGEDFFTIVTLKNSFHGRTIATLSATGQDVFHEDFKPLLDGFVYATANDVEDFKKVVEGKKIAAVMIELCQGEGGVLPLSKEFVSLINDYCKENNVLLIIDEVQTGNGRSGELYAFQSYGILPDVFTTAKGLAGGLPLGACVMGEKVENTLTYGKHGSTFGGNPIACAGAISILDRIDEKLLLEVKKKSEAIFEKLKDAEGIESVSGIGLMIGIKTKKPCAEVVKNCQDNGVLVLTAKDKVRLLPPLNIPYSLLEKAIEVIKKACL